MTNISSSIQTVSTSGNFSTPFGTQVSDTRGLVLLGKVSAAPATSASALAILGVLMLLAGTVHLRMRAARTAE